MRLADTDERGTKYIEAAVVLTDMYKEFYPKSAEFLNNSSDIAAALEIKE